MIVDIKDYSFLLGIFNTAKTWFDSQGITIANSNVDDYSLFRCGMTSLTSNDTPLLTSTLEEDLMYLGKAYGYLPQYIKIVMKDGINLKVFNYRSNLKFTQSERYLNDTEIYYLPEGLKVSNISTINSIEADISNIQSPIYRDKLQNIIEPYNITYTTIPLEVVQAIAYVIFKQAGFYTLGEPLHGSNTMIKLTNFIGMIDDKITALIRLSS